jgi:O-antigen ligase
MWGIIIAGIVAIQLLLGFVSPIGLIYFVLAVGALPMTFGDAGSVGGAFGRMDLPAFRVLGLWLAASLVLLLRPAKVPRYVSAYRFHLLFLVFCAAAMAWAPSISYAMRMFAKLSAPLLFLLLLTTTVINRRQLKVIEALIVLSALGMLAAAVALRLAGIKVNPVGITVPGVGPSLFSALLVVVAVLALATVKYRQRLRNAAIVTLCSAGVLAAFTRITIAALFVGCSAVLFVGFRGIVRLLLPATALVGFPLLFLLNESFKRRMFFGESQVTLDSVLTDPSILLSHLHTSGRSGAWGNVLAQFFAPNPTFGSGLGATQNYFYTQSGGIGVIHSEYVRLLSEVGICGIALFAIAALAYLWRMARIYRRARSADTARYALSAVGVLVAYLVYIATDNGFDYVTGFGIYVFALVGMAEKSHELDKSAAAAATRLAGS